MNLAFDDHLFSYITLDLRKDFLGTLKDGNGRALHISFHTRDASLHFFSLGVTFGLIFYL